MSYRLSLPSLNKMIYKISCAGSKIHLPVFILALAVFIIPVFSFSSDINVPEDYPSIQSAIDSAAEGDVITVAKGTYNELIHFKGKNITLQSSDPTDTNTVALTIIDGNTSGSVVTFAGTELSTCTLSGFTIMNGKAEYGAGIHGGTYPVVSHATIQNNVITTNTATVYGGGLSYCFGLIQNNTITGCHAVGGGAFVACNGTIQNNKVYGNSATSGGGAFSGCSGIMQNNIIFNNTAKYGGAFHHCNGLIQGNIITGNSAVNGGAIWENSGTIQNNIISKNKADVGGGIAGGRKIIRNNIFSQNYAAKSGGGLAFCSGATIENNIIIQNTAEKYGGGIYSSTGVIQNNIIWSNAAPRMPQIGDSALPNYCCILDWTEGGTGNIKDDPMFANIAENDFHLLDNSPCLDAGNPTEQLNDGCRPPGRKSVRNDMGVYGGPQNCNWGINITKDMLINYLIGRYSFSPEELPVANYNKDPQVTIADLIFLINLLGD